MDFPRIFNANLRLIWAKCYLKNRWLHCIQTCIVNILHTTDYYSAIIIFHGLNSLISIPQCIILEIPLHCGNVVNMPYLHVHSPTHSPSANRSRPGGHLLMHLNLFSAKDKSSHISSAPQLSNLSRHSFISGAKRHSNLLSCFFLTIFLFQ